MFNNQENSFLQAIQKMLSSTNNDDRIKAEQDIHLWAKESYLQIKQNRWLELYCSEDLYKNCRWHGLNFNLVQWGSNHKS